MLAERMIQWKKEWAQEAWAQGIQKGMEEGIEQGIEKGIEQGIEQGIQKGLEQEKLLLCRMVSKRFGQDAYEQTLPVIQKAHSAKVLDRIGELIIDCQTDDEFVSHLVSL